MGRRNNEMVSMLFASLAQNGAQWSWGKAIDVYTVSAADLHAAEEEVLLRQRDWQRAGGVRLVDAQVAEALQKAEQLQEELQQGKAGCRQGIRLRYLRFVRLFVLTGLPRRYQESPGLVLAASVSAILAVAALPSAIAFPSLGSALLGLLVIAALVFMFVWAIFLSLWPTEYKQQSFQRLQREWRLRKNRKESLESAAVAARRNYEMLQQHWDLHQRLEQARRRRDELAALLSSAKYQLVHTDWRSLRDDEFEEFLRRVFEMLGYSAQITNKPDQGVDLVVVGKGIKLAVQAKGYYSSVSNSAVQEVVTGMNYHIYQCTSCVVITNSRFTRPAKRLAHDNRCGLVEGSQIPDLIEGRIY